MNCREATTLISQGMDLALRLGQRLRLKIHVTRCAGCRKFQKNMDFLRCGTMTLSGIDNVVPKCKRKGRV